MNHIEVEAGINPTSLAEPSAILSDLQTVLTTHCNSHDLTPGLLALSPSLSPNLSSLRLANFSTRPATTEPSTSISHISCTSGTPLVPAIHLYRLNTDPPEDDTAADDDHATHTITSLPNKHLCGLWESLSYGTSPNGSSIKTDLLSYAISIITLASLSLDPNICTVNRVVLLYGPPGTGKTSLAKALAHKAAIRTSNLFTTSTLLEINSHSLFSRWFSESGKKIVTLFDHIASLCEDPNHLVLVLVDEVESLTAARSVTAGEPTDGLRAVNAILTSLDRLKQYSNAVVITTSNMVGGEEGGGVVDAAFLSRCDMKIYVGDPVTEAVYDIAKSWVVELMRVGILTDSPLAEFASAQAANAPLYAAAVALTGCSGRLLRKIPVMTYMKFEGRRGIASEEFLRKAVEMYAK